MRRSKTEETLGDGINKSPDPVDVHVGRRLRLRRTLLGMSQEQLANAVGVTFQQIQKYERGSNRVSASRLYDISKVLGVPVAFFFEDIGDEVTSARLAPIVPDITGSGLSEPAIPAYEQDPLQKNETLELIRAYWRLPTDTVRKRALDLLKSLSGRD
ncbi:helix-turn-helix domain-containing protein [Rhodospirillum rubrum]|uniref:Transcriptional regulator, XRE family n=1 Tax=Rhodospirillum rubrum (strain ATCC 11170 / ATH 1.1.1 / DSM 467 / LMG 4362 / NCIMB 8255 / S1) TaxID=269796 RepID=Q2RNA3_RHORT|nr:helix-turn-helix transcriptional regulator [Rhodospirillum rubrum]ABC24392.1 transcriptional regulator, XRE family [Rhodospirillum rubrum ATCC 11170]MBK5956112.1 transcriptional regulator [Rhodospirillum rubrum]QXG80316.1 helix-turn-helix domain-containing protein [Rhodospirillum rubrum]